MSSYVPTQAVNTATTRPARPAFLVIGMAAGIIGAITAIVTAVQVLAGGRKLVEDATEELAKAQGVSMADLKSLGGDMLNSLIDDATDTMHARAMILLVGAVLTLVSVALCWNAATWARVLSTVMVSVLLICWMVATVDEFTTMLKVGPRIALASLVLTIVFLWLKPVNRYRKSLKASA